MDPGATVLAWPPAAWQWEAMLRLAVAGMLGGLVGLEREYHGRAAGFRTHALVSMGCCLVMIVSLHFARMFPLPSYTQQSVIRLDPARIAYGVMAGMGFLGAGAIIRSGLSIRGLTTAASLWCIAAVGLAVGVGLYIISLAGTAMVLFTLFVLNYLEGRVHRRWYKRVRIACDDRPVQIERFSRLMRSADVAILDMDFQREVAERRLRITFYVRLRDRQFLPRLYELLDGQDGLQSVEVS